MRTDQPWLEVVRNAREALAVKPQPLVEEEVALGRLLFGPGRRQWLAILGTVLGMGGASATLSSTAYRGANGAAVSQTTGASNLLYGDCLEIFSWCGGSEPVRKVEGPGLHAILPAGRRLDPAQRA